MKTVLIVEDNIRNMEMLVKIIENLEEEIMIKRATNLEEASSMILKYNIDLFMLDIILDPDNSNDASGMKFAEHIRTFQRYKYTPIIFITALEDPQLHAYSELHCYSYVEKPYDANKVSAVILEALAFPKAGEESRSVFFRKDGILYKKKISEIVYIENSRRGQIVHCTNGNLKLPYKPNKKILEELGSDKFVQCSRYVIVNKDFIDKIDIVNRYIELFSLKEQIEIGESFKKNFLKDVTGKYGV